MSEFEEFSPDSWEFEGVLWVVPKKALSERAPHARRSPWLAVLPLTAAFAATVLSASPDMDRGGSAVLAALEQTEYEPPDADGSAGDLVPAGYWERYGQFFRSRPDLVEADGTDPEPLL